MSILDSRKFQGGWIGHLLGWMQRVDPEGFWAQTLPQEGQDSRRGCWAGWER